MKNLSISLSADFYVGMDKIGNNDYSIYKKTVLIKLPILILSLITKIYFSSEPVKFIIRKNT